MGDEADEEGCQETRDAHEVILDETEDDLNPRGGQLCSFADDPSLTCFTG